MSRKLIRSRGGTVTLPDRRTTMIDRGDGGQLVVYPPRHVWDRTVLSLEELTDWNVLVAATAAAMLDVLPQLNGGCINYWDAGNWALHPDAEPVGPKRGVDHRSLHLHLLGRSPHSRDPSWGWGEAPVFPRFKERECWSLGKAPLTPPECCAIVSRLVDILRRDYGHHDALDVRWVACTTCGYPMPSDDGMHCPSCLGECAS